jgi:hypothetical protein
MKVLVFVFLLSFSSFFSIAQQSGVTIHQDEKIAELMTAYKSFNKENDFKDGYRIQVMFSNVRDEAYGAKAKLYKDFPKEKCYVEYEQPYYKLRLGDMVTRLEATNMLNQVLPLYQGAFIVKDKVRTR